MPLVYEGTTIKKVVYNGAEIYRLNFNGTEVFRKPSVYNAEANALPIGTFSHVLAFTSGGITCRADRQHTGWSAYWADAFDRVNANWWTGQGNSDDKSWDNLYFTWGSSPKWLSQISLKSPQTTWYKACPRYMDVYVMLVPNGDWSNASHWTYWGKKDWGESTAQNQWKYMNDDYKHEDGIYGIKLRFQNDYDYKPISQSPRIGEIQMMLGSVTKY